MSLLARINGDSVIVTDTESRTEWSLCIWRGWRDVTADAQRLAELNSMPPVDLIRLMVEAKRKLELNDR